VTGDLLHTPLICGGPSSKLFLGNSTEEASKPRRALGEDPDDLGRTAPTEALEGARIERPEPLELESERSAVCTALGL
jgi:hypothetical protein